MHELIRQSIDALEQPGFRDAFVRFLALQRYDLTPYGRVLGVDNQPEHGKVTVGGRLVSGTELADRFVDFLTRTPRRCELMDLAEEFWHAFPDAVGDAGPPEYVQACRMLGDAYESRCMMPMLSAPLHALSPGRVLDFGCGANRLGPAMQAMLRQAGLPVPTIIGVDIHPAEGAFEDPAAGVYLHDLRSQPLATIVGEPVDVIILKYVLHHMTASEQEAALSVLAGFLAPGGRVIVLEASVDTNQADAQEFEEGRRGARIWPQDDWSTPYWIVSRNFYGATGHAQRMLLCLEDLFGHVLLPGPTATPLRMPLPFSYLGRDAVTRLAAKGGLEPDRELSAVLGMPPLLKHGPPSSRLAFRPTP
jgi:SAM-dependent methyltransferase